jgi:rubrerythrin
MRALAQDAAARVVNAQPWEPLPGMLKLRCIDCHFWFAARDPAIERCPNCAATEQRRLASEAARRATQEAT